MAFNKDQYFKSLDIKVFPAAYRGEKYNLEARFPTEYNLIHTGNIGKNKNSFVLDFNTDTKVLKCVIGGYYFEINTTGYDLADKNFYIYTEQKTISETEDVELGQSQDIKSDMLASFEDGEQDLDTLENPDDKTSTSYFTGLLFSSVDPVFSDNRVYAAKLEKVFLEDGSINTENFVPLVNTGKTANSITLGDKGNDKNEASGDASFAHGKNAIANGVASHAEGNGTTASNNAAHAEGLDTTASGQYSHAEGNGATASGESAHAEGVSTTASGAGAHAEGLETIASRDNQTVVGKYNAEEDGEFIVGIGADNDNRKNALVVKGDTTTIREKLYVKKADIDLFKIAEEEIIGSETPQVNAAINADNINFNLNSNEHIDINKDLIKICLHKDTTGTSRGKLVFSLDGNKTKAELNAANVKLVGDTDITGAATISETLNVTKGTTIGKKLTVSSEGADITGDSTITGKLQVTDKLTVNNGASITGATNITGNTKVTGKLNVTDETTIKDLIITSNNSGDVLLKSGDKKFNIASNTEINLAANTYKLDVNAGLSTGYYRYAFDNAFRIDYNNMLAKLGLENYDQGKKLRLSAYDNSAREFIPFEINSSDLIIRKDTSSRSIKISSTNSTDIIPGGGSGSGTTSVFININGDASGNHLDIDKDCDIWSSGGATFNNIVQVNGNFKVGEKVIVDKNIGKVTAVSFNATSDKRLKKNLALYTPEKSILDLPIYKFDYISGAQNQIGCMAQDLQQICPELVDKNDSGLLTIQETKLVYLLLDEVKKLKEEIKDLKK